MFKKLTTWFFTLRELPFLMPHDPLVVDRLIEGWSADQYQDPNTQAAITEAYLARWVKAQTPATHPELYDPLHPPQGWKYDPFYEIWYQL